MLGETSRGFLHVVLDAHSCACCSPAKLGDKLDFWGQGGLESEAGSAVLALSGRAVL